MTGSPRRIVDGAAGRGALVVVIGGIPLKARPWWCDARTGRACRPGRRSDALAQVARDRAVVAERLVEVPGLRAVVARRHLDERGADLGRRPLGLRHQQSADAALTDARIHDQ